MSPTDIYLNILLNMKHQVLIVLFATALASHAQGKFGQKGKRFTSCAPSNEEEY
jgi:hypothetical protein